MSYAHKQKGMDTNNRNDRSNFNDIELDGLRVVYLTKLRPHLEGQKLVVTPPIEYFDYQSRGGELKFRYNDNDSDASLIP